VPGLEIKRDGTVLGRTTWGTSMPVDRGEHTIVATAPGKSPWETQVTIRDNGERKIVMIPPLRDRPLESPPAAPGDKMSLAGPVAAWVATASVTVASIATGALAVRASHDFTAKLDVFPGDPQAISDARVAASRLALACDLLAGAALAGAGISTYLTVRYKRDHADQLPSAARIVIHPRGVTIEGSF